MPVNKIRVHRGMSVRTILIALTWELLRRPSKTLLTLNTSTLKIILSLDGMSVEDKRTGDETCISDVFGYVPRESSAELRLLERGLNALIRANKDSIYGYHLERKVSDRKLYRIWYRAFGEHNDQRFVQ